ncbi:MAG: hypothetical protein U0168_07300 [Nannocystaceae bacterium]
MLTVHAIARVGARQTAEQWRLLAHAAAALLLVILATTSLV